VPKAGATDKKAQNRWQRGWPCYVGKRRGCSNSITMPSETARRY
jgi:hypothetical protein